MHSEAQSTYLSLRKLCDTYDLSAYKAVNIETIYLIVRAYEHFLKVPIGQRLQYGHRNGVIYQLRHSFLLVSV